MQPSARVLIVDDDTALCDILSDVLVKEGYDVSATGSGNAALEILKNHAFHVMLLDLLLPGYNGMEVLQRLQKTHPALVVIMMSGHGTIQSAMEATRLGAFDWLEKPLKKERILITVANALNKSRMLSEKNILLSEARERYAMVGVSPPMKMVFKRIDKVALTHTSVLITGESGTGKELAARAVHMHSPRAGQPFIEVNCAAVPETLIESELFGHVRGAFTGAHRDKKGRFQVAHGGTLFLDEIGELSPAAQAKLLRVLENGEVAPVGQEHCGKVDVRIIAATNKDLHARVQEGLFREDLFHRINVVDIHMPPLRERNEDILPMLQHFIDEFTSEYKLEPKRFLPDAEAVILSYDWPGNVRQLKNFAEKLIVLAPESEIRSSHVSEILHGKEIPSSNDSLKSYKEAKESFEKHYLLNALNAHQWNVTETAEAIDMPRSLLYKKMEKYRLK